MKIEYLILIDSESRFCKTSQAFNSFLQSDSEIRISGHELLFKMKKYRYELQEGDSSDSHHKFFHIKVYSDSESLDEFSELARAIKRILHINQENSIQTLWDDISFHYSNKSYPIVHEVENLMRKLITKFMLITVGLGWTKETIPEELKKSSRSERIESNNNYLYEIDFIQLANFLFDEYQTLDINELIEKISRIAEESFMVSEISDFIPKSNWERYFQKSVDCEGSYLKTRWEKLYKLRCKIAHNNVFSKADYEQVEKLSSEVKIKLNSAIESLDKIHVTEEEREGLAESVAEKSNKLVSSFIQKWKLIESVSLELLIKKGFMSSKLTKQERLHFYKHRVLLIENKLISREEYESIQNLNKVRNIIVHERDQYFTEADIMLFVKDLDKVVEKLSEKLLED